MCDPATAVMVTASVASSAAAQSARNKQAEARYAQSQAQYQSQKRVNKANREEAMKAAAEDYGLLQTRMIQEAEAAAEQKYTLQRRGRQARAKARVAAAAAGVIGNSTDAVVQDFNAKQARVRDSIDQNLGNTMFELNSQMEKVQSRARSRIRGIAAPAAPIAPNSGLNMGLAIGSAALNSTASWANSPAGRQTLNG